MKYLLVVAHGSRRVESNDEVRQLVAEMSKKQHEFDAIGAAFLELAEPLIPDGIISAIKNGADEIVVLPYFLSAGRHVTSDVPADVESVKQQYPNIKITIAPYLGSSPKLLDIMFELAG